MSEARTLEMLAMTATYGKLTAKHDRQYEAAKLECQ